MNAYKYAIDKCIMVLYCISKVVIAMVYVNMLCLCELLSTMYTWQDGDLIRSQIFTKINRLHTTTHTDTKVLIA